MEIQYMNFTCNNKSAFMKYHVVKKKNITCTWPLSCLRSHSILVLLVVAYFSSFTIKLTSILYQTTAKHVKVVLNLLFTVQSRDVPK